jgi:O-antigen/teichoic acid export membrane protein
MRTLRKLLMYASAVFALINLVGVVLALLTLNWAGAGWSLLRAAGWTAVCVYLLRLEKNAAPPSVTGS